MNPKDQRGRFAASPLPVNHEPTALGSHTTRDAPFTTVPDHVTTPVDDVSTETDRVSTRPSSPASSRHSIGFR